MGTGFKYKSNSARNGSIAGNAQKHEDVPSAPKKALADNAQELKGVYPLSTGGYFGKIGRSGASNVRNIVCDDPEKEAKKFFDLASSGGEEIPMENGNGVSKKMSDGCYVSYRGASSSDGSPAIDINTTSGRTIDGIKSQKIHFVKGATHENGFTDFAGNM